MSSFCSDEKIQINVFCDSEDSMVWAFSQGFHGQGSTVKEAVLDLINAIDSFGSDEEYKDGEVE